MKVEHSLMTYTEVNSKWINDPIVRLDSMKIPRGKLRQNTLT